jgi:two-component system, cell cycle response regulator DivK
MGRSSPTESPESDVVAGSPFAGATVLVVDDLALDRKLVRVLLSREGCRVEIAHDSSSARLQLASFRPDVVVLDLRIPQDEPLDLARELKSSAPTRDISILAVSAYRGEDEARAAGCDAFLAKPIDIEDFVGTVRQLLGTAGRRS